MVGLTLWYKRVSMERVTRGSFQQASQERANEAKMTEFRQRSQPAGANGVAPADAQIRTIMESGL